MRSRSLWDSTLRYLVAHGAALPTEIVDRDPATAYEPSPAVQNALIALYRDDPQAGLVFERLVDIDEGLQEWRYRHVRMVERTIGRKVGTGGSSGADYLRTTLFTPVFPDLWEIRSEF